MLHAKFVEIDPPTGTGEEIFLRDFSLYGHGGHLIFLFFLFFLILLPYKLHGCVMCDVK